MLSPAAWNLNEVENWADSIKLPKEARDALVQNKIDGKVLLTLSREELREELQISSLAGRRFLWDAIERLRYQHVMSDFGVALDVHNEDIENLVDSSAEVFDPGVVQVLREEVDIKRQLVEDNFLARNLESPKDIQVYEDELIATDCQSIFDQQCLQEQFDHQFALSLSQRPSSQQRSGRQSTNNSLASRDEPRAFQSLTELCISSCVKNKVNVAEALESGSISVIKKKNFETESTTVLSDLTTQNFDQDERKMPASPLSRIARCSVCYEQNARGFALACSHSHCQTCMSTLLRTALKDSSLLPLTCCEIPIDMNVSAFCLSLTESNTLQQRLIELQASKKMYCPYCSCFINLDLVDTSESNALQCLECYNDLCAQCATASHPGLSCQQNKRKLDKDDAAVISLCKAEGWKQCPSCSIMIQLHFGCNHMICSFCQHEFCYKCLANWNSDAGLCASGKCERWEEENLLEGGEMRVRAQEEVRGHMFQPQERQRRLGAAISALRTNECCEHEWEKRSLFGECERCGYELHVYGMVCQGTCQSTVCYTCAHHRIPQRGWR